MTEYEFMATGCIVLVLGTILPELSLRWIRPLARQNHKFQRLVSRLESGRIFAILCIPALVFGLSTQYWAAESTFGLWISTGDGTMIFGFIAIAIAFVIERAINIYLKNSQS